MTRRDADADAAVVFVFVVLRRRKTPRNEPSVVPIPPREATARLVVVVVVVVVVRARPPPPLPPLIVREPPCITHFFVAIAAVPMIPITRASSCVVVNEIHSSARTRIVIRARLV